MESLVIGRWSLARKTPPKQNRLEWGTLMGSGAASRGLRLMIVALAVTLGMGASDANVRFATIGHRMMCPCGCNQILLECNHVGCPDSDRMRTELAALVKSEPSDDKVEQAFATKYGPTVLAAPTMHGFNLLAWIMPFAALVLGSYVVVHFARRFRLLPAAAPAARDALSDGEVEMLRRRARQETEI